MQQYDTLLGVEYGHQSGAVYHAGLERNFGLQSGGIGNL